MKKYPYVPADLVKSVNSVLDKRQNVIEQGLRDRYQLDEAYEGISYDEAQAKFNQEGGSAFTGFYVQKHPEHAIKWLMSAPFNHPNRKVIEDELAKRLKTESPVVGVKSPSYKRIADQLISHDKIGLNTIVKDHPEHAKLWLRRNRIHPNAKAVEDILRRNGLLEQVTESPVVGVIKGQLPDDQHLCATKIFSEEYGEGTPVYSMHADPDEHGSIEWYDVMFEHGIERVFTDDVEVLEEMNHGDDHDDNKKKKGGNKHKKNHMKKDDDKDDDMKAESEIFESKIIRDSLKRSAEIPSARRKKIIKRSLERSAEIPSARRKKTIEDSKKRREERRSGKAPSGMMGLIRNIFGSVSEAKEEPTFDIEKSLPTNAHRSGYQVAQNSTNKADLKHAISQAVEHPRFKEKMLNALAKAQNHKEVLQIAQQYLDSQASGPSNPRVMSFLKNSYEPLNENTAVERAAGSAGDPAGSFHDWPINRGHKNDMKSTKDMVGDDMIARAANHIHGIHRKGDALDTLEVGRLASRWIGQHHPELHSKAAFPFKSNGHGSIAWHSSLGHRVARALRANHGWEDGSRPARFGGKEYALLLPTGKNKVTGD